MLKGIRESQSGSEEWRRLERPFTVLLKPEEEGGYAVRCVELPAAISYGETREKALENIREAISLVLQELENRVCGPLDSCKKEIVLV